MSLMLVNPFWFDAGGGSTPGLRTELENGDFEEGPSQTAWVLLDNTIIAGSFGFQTANGSYAAFGGDNYAAPGTGTIYQDVSLTSEEIQTNNQIEVSLEYTLNTSSPDTVTAHIEVYDENDSLIETFSDGPTNTSGINRRRLFGSQISLNANWFRIKFEITNLSGSEANGMVDDVVFSRETLQDAISFRYAVTYAITGHSNNAVAMRMAKAYVIVTP